VSGGLFLWLIIRKKIYRNMKDLLLLCLLVILFPLAFNFIHVMQGANYEAHYLMIYGLILAPVFCLAILQLAGEEAEERKKREKSLHGNAISTASWVVIVSLALCVYGYWVRSNQVYLKLHLVYEQGYAYSNTLLTRIQSTEHYTGTEEVIFVGSPHFGHDIPELHKLHGMVGIIDSIPEAKSYAAFLRYYLANTRTILRPSQKELAEMGLTEIVEGMTFYPKNGSILRIDGDRILVRFPGP